MRERGKMRTRERNRSWNMESIWRLGDAKILRNLRHIGSVRVVFLRYSHSDAVSISLIVVNNNDFFLSFAFVQLAIVHQIFTRLFYFSLPSLCM